MVRSLASTRQGSSQARHWESWAEFQIEGRPWLVSWGERFSSYGASVAILDSIEESGLADRFQYSWGGSVRALWVALPLDEQRFRDAIEVCDPNFSRVPDGLVRIQHEAFTGLTDSIERPIGDAVPLFWRFVSEKFGIESPKDRRPV